MLEKRTNSFQYGSAICYSGFRAGQNPGENIFPSEDQVLEDIRILAANWNYIRLYDPNIFAQTVLEIIKKEKLGLKVMIGICLDAEQINPACPWQSGSPSEDAVNNNIKKNDDQIDRLIKLANDYSDIVFSVSVGNEATVDWSDHLVPVNRIIDFARKIRANCMQPVTFCENYVPWLYKLQPLVDEIDFISIHTYPIWENRSIEEAIQYSIDNYISVKEKYPEKIVIISEAGWTTRSNGRGVPPEYANEEMQKIYYERFMEWCKLHDVLTFFFEAFDEPWKGSDDPLDPEKHWGLYTVDRKPKVALRV